MLTEPGSCLLDIVIVHFEGFGAISNCKKVSKGVFHFSHNWNLEKLVFSELLHLLGLQLLFTAGNVEFVQREDGDVVVLHLSLLRVQVRGSLLQDFFF